MINQNIGAIFLDHGNTMRIVVEDESFRNLAEQQLVEMIGTNEPPDVFCKRLDDRYGIYKKRAKETLLQDSAAEVWVRWMLPEYPSNKIAPLANQLTCLWRDRKGRRILQPDAKQAILELHRRGYILGVIANSLSETEIPDWLKAEGRTQYFKSVVISSKFGRRKPDPYIYLEAAALAGVKPQNCVYVGDNPERDVKGAKHAGFGATIILRSNVPAEETYKGEVKPDLFISKFGELLKIFPQR